MKFGEYFIAKEKLNNSSLDKALKIQEKKGGYIGEILVNLEYISEEDLLSYISKKFGVQYISSEKLKKMAIKEKISDVIPYKFAKENYVFPLKFRASDGKLNLLTHEPQNKELIKKIKLFFSDITRIECVVAHSRAIKALILKQYSGDLAAFERLVERGINLGSTVPAGETVFPTDETNEGSRESTGRGFSQIINQGEILNSETTGTFSTGFIPDKTGERTAKKDIIQLIKVFSGIMDAYRGKKFKGHTYRVASLCRLMGKAAGISDVDLENLSYAAFLHDAGQKYHLSAFDIKNPEKSETVIKYANLPRRLFSSLGFLKIPVNYLSSMYETFNGKGYPNRLRLQEIPLCSQILLLSDTYDYLTNILETPISKAFNNINELHFFSNEIMDTFKKLKNIPESNSVRRTLIHALVMSADKTTIYDINELFINHHIKTIKHSHIESAAISLKKHFKTIKVVICDIKVKNTGISPLKFLKAMKSDKRMKQIPFILVSSERISPEIEKRAGQLGAENIIADFSAEEHIDELIKLVKKHPHGTA